MRTQAYTPGDTDDGFSILEVTIALAMILTVMVASTLFFVRAMGTSLLNEQRQDASVLVDEALEQARSLTPAQLLEGRTPTAVDTQQTTQATAALLGPSTLLPVVTDAFGLPVDLTAPALPLTQNRSMRGTSFLVRSFVDGCVRPLVASAPCDANPSPGSPYLTHDALYGTAGSAPTARLMLRVTVSVSWAGRSDSCHLAGDRCESLSTTLVDTGSDPTFENGS